jgi:predicted DNA-binding transcriptional regulator AlpA
VSKKLLTYRDLEARGHGSRVTIWRKTKDSSLKFPQPIDIGYVQKRFLDDEMEAYEEYRATMREAQA